MELNFPIAQPCQWRRPEQLSVTPQAAEWLLEEGSLTQKLKHRCKHFQVEVLGQGLAPIFDNEFELFHRHHMHTPFQASVREVLLYCDGKPWVFARSLFPLSALQHKNLNLSALGSASLGQSLFDQDDLLRSPFELTQLDSEHPVAKLNHSLYDASHSLWGRRSLFLTDGQRVLVSEIFLSPVPFYEEQR